MTWTSTSGLLWLCILVSTEGTLLHCTALQTSNNGRSAGTSVLGCAGHEHKGAPCWTVCSAQSPMLLTASMHLPCRYHQPLHPYPATSQWQTGISHVPALSCRIEMSKRIHKHIMCRAVALRGWDRDNTCGFRESYRTASVGSEQCLDSVLEIAGGGQGVKPDVS